VPNKELKVANGPILGDPIQFKYLGNKFFPSTIFLAIHIFLKKYIYKITLIKSEGLVRCPEFHKILKKSEFFPSIKYQTASFSKQA
jgi:hypothetical protein